MEQQTREERRKKIKALEASLFGPDNEWTSKSVELPELKNVNEYTTRLETVETRKGTQTASNLTRLKTAPKKKSTMILQALADTRRNIKTSSTSAKASDFDNIALLTDDQLDQQTSPTTETEVNFKSRRHLERPMSKSQRILKSEVAQLDDAFNKIFNEEPQQSMLDNLKKKHGLGLNNNKYQRFDHQKSLDKMDTIQVEAFNQKMNRARILDTLPTQPKLEKSNRTRRASLHEQQPDLSVIGHQVSKPNITVDQAPKPKRSMPVQLDKNRLSVGEVEGLISYAQLEKIPSKIEDQQAYGKASEGTFDDMPTNTFSDMPRTFEDIPADVFDHIPRAVTAREERRLLKLQEKLVQERLEKEQDSSTQKHCNKKVSFIAALFKSPSMDDQGKSPTVSDDADLMAAAKEKPEKEHEGDFLFALFIAQEEESTLANEASTTAEATNKLESSASAGRTSSSPTVGHFCAPFSPGFCQANFCIFHHPKAQ